MSDASLPQIEPAEHVGALIREMVHGDLSLRWKSLSALGKGSLAPTLLFARQLRGKLSLAVSETEEKRLFFFFKTQSDAQRIADIRVRFALAPSMERRARGATASATELEPPIYLIDSGNARQLRLRFTDNRPVAVQFDAADALTVHRSDDRPYDEDEPWPLNLSIGLIDGIAHQSRTNEIGAPRPFVAPDDEILSRVLKKVVHSYRDIVGTLGNITTDKAVSDLNTRLRDWHRDLDGNYRFNELFSRVLVRIGKNGKLVMDHKDDETHQLDVEARFVPVGDSYALRYRFRIPDLLAAGDYHSRFLQAVRQKGADDFFRKAASIDDTDWSKEQFRAFLEHSDQDRSALFIRTGRRTRHRKRDRDLVLLRAPLAGRNTELLFETDFEVKPYPEVRVSDMDVKNLLGFRLGDGAWQSSESSSRRLPQLYLSGLLRTLRGWQKGMARAGS